MFVPRENYILKEQRKYSTRSVIACNYRCLKINHELLERQNMQYAWINKRERKDDYELVIYKKVEVVIEKTEELTQNLYLSCNINTLNPSIITSLKVKER
jgi:hypothetical protein